MIKIKKNFIFKTALLLLSILLFLFFYRLYIYNFNMATNWKNDNAKKYLFSFSDRIKTNPSVLADDENGIAIWTKKDLENTKLYDMNNCFEEHVLRDESVKHLCPGEHRDFFYSYIKVNVKPEQAHILLSISGSVSYDPLKNLISARCGSVEANIATLKLVTDLLLNNKVNDPKNLNYSSLEEVHKNNIYSKMINNTIDSSYAKYLYEELCNNVNKLQNDLNKGYWNGAFSYNNNKCSAPKYKVYKLRKV